MGFLIFWLICSFICLIRVSYVAYREGLRTWGDLLNCIMTAFFLMVAGPLGVIIIVASYIVDNIDTINGVLDTPLPKFKGRIRK